MTIKKILFFALLALLLPSVCLGQTPAYGPKASMHCTVEEIMVILNHDRLMRDENRKERRMLILAVVRHRFDFEEMARRTLAREWKKRNDKEKKHFINVFSQLLENTYINKIEAYSGEQVVFSGESIAKNKAVVSTHIKQDNLEIPMQYKLLISGNEWRVYDVIIEGVSLVRNYRSQFQSILKKEKYAGLVKRLDEKIQTIEREES
jgi:phospholipid transport system substrate-binding protein